MDEAAIFLAVYDELQRIKELWGEQHHLDGTGDRFFEFMARDQRRINANPKKLTWQGILAEEYYEASAETDPDKLVTELVQVAAVALSWVREIRGRGRGQDERAA